MTNDDKATNKTRIVKKTYRPKPDIGGTTQPKAPAPTKDERPAPPPSKDD